MLNWLKCFAMSTHYYTVDIGYETPLTLSYRMMHCVYASKSCSIKIYLKYLEICTWQVAFIPGQWRAIGFKIKLLCCWPARLPKDCVAVRKMQPQVKSMGPAFLAVKQLKVLHCRTFYELKHITTHTHTHIQSMKDTVFFFVQHLMMGYLTDSHSHTFIHSLI